MISADAPLDSTISIVTPENIAFEYRAAGPFRRLPAFLADMAICLVAYIGLGIVAGLMGVLLAGLAEAVMLIGFFLIYWFYGGLFETFMNGQTPGKRLMGIRVLTTDGQPINGLQAVMRNILRAVDMMPFLSVQALGIDAPMYLLPIFTLGLAVMALNPRFQRLGDMVCGTMVVLEERHWLSGVAQLEDERAAQLAMYIPPDFRPSRTLAQAVSTYVERRRFFSVPRRREIARHLAEPLLERFEMRSDTSHDLLLCAVYYRTFIADRVNENHRFESPFAITPGTPLAASASGRQGS
ncbi:MAG: RDD family protein [Planctomycetes bacterium]|nr:RDD family protein [Planctomycetota bacterium]